MQWTNGGPLALAEQLKVRDAGVRQAAHGMMQELAAAADHQQKDLIERAQTPTGRRRAATRGGSAGRIETGQMVNSTNASAIWVSDDTISAKWGWQDPEDYYRYQDQGTRSIAPALTLLTTFLVARSDFLRKIRLLGWKDGR